MGFFANIVADYDATLATATKEVNTTVSHASGKGWEAAIATAKNWQPISAAAMNLANLMSSVSSQDSNNVTQRAESAVKNGASPQEWQQISQDAKDEKALMELHGRPEKDGTLFSGFNQHFYDQRIEQLDRVISLADSRMGDMPENDEAAEAEDSKPDTDGGLPPSHHAPGTRGVMVEGTGGKFTTDAPATNGSTDQLGGAPPQYNESNDSAATDASAPAANGSSETTPQDSTADVQAKARARAIIDMSMNKEITANDSDDFIRENITPEILKYASASEKAHMLQSLMDGKTGEGDEQAMLLILNSVKSGSEMKEVLNGAGGAHEVMSELEDKAEGFIDGLKAGGKEGAEQLLAMLTTYDAGDSLYAEMFEHEFLEDIITPEVLEHASALDKAMLLDNLMTGKTTGSSEDTMLMILQSVDTKAEMDQVLAAAGGDARVMDELEEKAYPLYKDLS